MTTAINTQDVRPLTADEMDIVSGGAEKPIIIKLPGQVSIQIGKENGCFSVSLGGKLYASGGCGDPTTFYPPQ